MAFTTYIRVISSRIILSNILASYPSIALKIVRGNKTHYHGGASRERKLTKTLFVVTVAYLMLTLSLLLFLSLSLLL